MPDLSESGFGAVTGPEEGALRVLLVGGDRAALLERAALVCSTALTASEALNELAAFAPDVVVIDCPGTGTETAGLIARIRASAAVPEVSILFLGATRGQAFSECISTGADFALEQPVDTELFTALVRSQAAKARQLKDQRLQLAAALREIRYRQLALDAHAVVSMADSAGKIIYANEKLTELSGYSQAELIGQNHRMLKSDRHPPEFYADLWRTITAGKAWQGVICNRHKSGRLYWVQATIMPLGTPEGTPERYTSVQTDITYPVFREGLAASEAHLLSSREDSEEDLARVVVGEIERLLPATHGAIQLFEPGRDSLRLAVTSPFPAEHRRALAGLAEQAGLTPCALAAQRGDEVHIADMASHADFREFCNIALTAGLHACWSIPIRLAGGPVLGALTVYRHYAGPPSDLELEAGRRLAQIAGALIARLRQANALHAAEVELHRAEQRANVAIESARLGYWDVDIDTGKGAVNRRWHELLGYEPEEVGDAIHARWLERLHPEDRERTLEAGRRYKNGEIAEYEVEYRVLRAGGEIRWLASRGAIIERDGGGRPLRIAGVCQDITRRRQAEETAQRQAKLLVLLQQGMRDYLTRGELAKTADFLLQGVIELTGSEYGFTGEILRDGNGVPYLKTHALTNIAWNDATVRLYEEKAKEGLEFRNLDTLFGATIVGGEAVISNDPAHDPRRGGLPPGHPPLNAFLGIPVYNGTDLVAMYGLANRAGGYDAAWVDMLAPFDATYAAIVTAHREQRLRQQLVDDLQAAKEAAEAASRAKSAFLASMSHELRTPLNAILGYAQLIEMEDGVQGPGLRTVREGAHEVRQAGEHLLALINDVLDLARIEAGRMRVEVAPTHLAPLLAGCEAMVAALARQKSIALHLDHTSCEDLHVLADGTRLKQILLNFIANGIKYNRPHGTVHISCARHPDGQVRILVRDTGPGIPAHKQARLFTAFERLGAEKTAIEGTGIGLVISKHLIDMMSGKVGFESRVGEGSTFWVELPLHPATPEIAAGSERGESVGPVKAKTVLHIEDNPINIMLVGDVLAKKPCLRLVNATSAEEGLQLARQHVPDLILLDIRLPGMDGYAALAQLRQMEALARTPIIAVTASAMAHEAERGLAAGFTAYITKPLDIAQFLDLIDSHLGTDD